MSGITAISAKLVGSSPAQYVEVACDANGNLLTVEGSSSSGTGITPVVTASLATSKVLKAAAGNLYGLDLKTTTVGGTFLVHNTTSAPAAGAVTPVKAFDCPAQGTIVVSFDPPLAFSTGISVTFSIAATPFTQTDSATAFISGEVA